MEVSRAPSAPGFDPLGNPTAMGEAPGDTSRSYRREAGGVPKEFAGQDLEWYQWLNTQWQEGGSDAGGISDLRSSSIGMENLAAAVQNGTRTPVNIAGPGSFPSLSQWQLHQTSTHKKMGPAAQGLFQIRRSSGHSAAASGRPQSTSPTLRLGTSGHMQRRSSTSTGRRRAVPHPKPSWQRNRKAGGLAPLGGVIPDTTAGPRQRTRLGGRLSQRPEQHSDEASKKGARSGKPPAKRLFGPGFKPRTIVLPRQARDKHKACSCASLCCAVLR
jgi:hypothetical protein